MKISKLENEEEVINFPKVSNFGKVCIAKSGILELSEGNGNFQKEVEGSFGEKRLLGGWG